MDISGTCVFPWSRPGDQLKDKKKKMTSFERVNDFNGKGVLDSNESRTPWSL